jgi:hypothetical protein
VLVVYICVYVCVGSVLVVPTAATIAEVESRSKQGRLASPSTPVSPARQGPHVCAVAAQSCLPRVEQVYRESIEGIEVREQLTEFALPERCMCICHRYKI